MSPFRTGLLAVVLVVGCSAPPATQFDIVRPLSLQRCVPTFMVAEPARADLLVAGSVTLDFIVQAFLDCDFGVRDLESFSVELTDDDGSPISTQVEQVPVNGTTRRVSVSFTARGSGSVHLRFVAEPTIGVFSRSYRVIAPSMRVWTQVPSRSCDGLVDGPGGESLCVNNRRLELAGQAIEVDGVAATASLVWLLRPSSLEGWLLDGGTAVRVPLPSRAWAVAARGHQVAVSSAVGITVVDEGGGVRTLGLSPGASMVQALAFADDDTLLVSQPGGLARITLDASVPARPFAGLVPAVTMSGEGLWSIDSNDTLTLTRRDGGRAQTRGFAPPPTEGFALPDQVPLLQPGGGTVALVGIPMPAPDGGITVDLVQLPPQVTASWLTSRWLFARDLSAGTLWMAPRVP
ncbi:MAG: hypothetical protein ABTQ32_27575 [Myxococcaceae bacterium]